MHVIGGDVNDDKACIHGLGTNGNDQMDDEA